MFLDERKRRILPPTRVVCVRGNVQNAEELLQEKEVQATFACAATTLTGKGAGILLDYGREIHGCLRVVTGFFESPGNRARVRISLGESVSEALAVLGGEKNATNDHALRDVTYDMGFLSVVCTGETGFRFAYIELLEDVTVSFKCIPAVAVERDLPCRGAFSCSDPLLEKIWQVAVRTVHLNMQDFLWDGIKRDRLIWVGDMHTEVLTILSAFGDVSLVEKSLSVMEREVGDGYMNGMFTYSMWWVMIRYELYMATGDAAPLRRNKDYLVKMLAKFAAMPEASGGKASEGLFLDWPTYSDPQKSSAGISGVLRLTLEQGSFLLRALGEPALAEKYEKIAAKMPEVCHPDAHGSKAAMAFMALADLTSPEKAAKELTEKGAAGYSTFLGYYLLQATAKTAGIKEALAALRSYWGGMLAMGATSFWEDFDLDWMENAAPIDRLPKEGEKDIHGDNGRHCYVGFRHSLCHGWASGPCPFLMHRVLGIRVEEPGMKRISLFPDLGDLSFAEGVYPTPYGDLWVRHERGEDGKIQTKWRAPTEVAVEICSE